MFDWTGCPAGFFDVYMEVGEIKALPAENGDYVPIEIWIGCCSSKTHIRPECENIRRRPVYGVLKQILKLCGDKQAYLIFACDETGNPGSDTTGQSITICMLLRELIRRNKVRHAVLYTGYFLEQVTARFHSRFFREQDRELYMDLYRLIDVLVLSQYNPYCTAPARRIYAGHAQILDALELLP